MKNAAESPFVVNRLEALPEPPPVVVTSTLPEPRRWWTSPAAIAVIAFLGIALRGAAWLNDRNLWIDESMLSLNLIERSPARLLEPLDWNQGAPIGFLLAVKTVIASIGITESSLRLVPMFGSLLGVIGFAWLALKFLPRPAATIAIALFSVSPFLISYAAECKQYATDAAIAIGLFASAASLLQGEGGFRRWAILAAAGAMAVWCSHPAAFILGGIGTALLADAILDKNRTRFLAAAATVACWLISFAACYLLCLKNLGNNQYLLNYWDGHFLPLPPKSPGDAAWLLDHFFAPFAYPGGLGGTEIRAGGIAAVFFLIGMASLGKRNWRIAIAMILPGLLALLASGLHKYPFAGRLLLFLTPIMVLGVAEGAYRVVAALARPLPIAAALFLGVLMAAPALETYQELRRPMRSEQLQPILMQVRGAWQTGDRMYVYYGALPAFTFYTREAPFPANAVTAGTETRKNEAEYREQLLPYQGQPRVWLVFSHRHHHEESTILTYAEGLGRCERVIRGEGAAAMLFNFAAAPGSASASHVDAGPVRDESKSADIKRGGDR